MPVREETAEGSKWMDPIVQAAKRAVPFDNTLTFSDEKGSPGRYITDPLQERYLVPPGDWVQAGMLPPEEFEVRAALVEAKIFTERVMSFGFFSLVFGTAKYRQAYEVAREKQRTLMELVNSSPAHKAAARRIVNDLLPSNGLRDALQSYIK